MAIKAVALGAIKEESIAAGGSGGVRLLTADLEDVFNHILYFFGSKKSLIAKLLCVLFGTVLRIVSQHIGFQSPRIGIAGTDTVTDRPFDIRGEFDVPA